MIEQKIVPMIIKICKCGCGGADLVVAYSVDPSLNLVE